jgi:endonuclease G
MATKKTNPRGRKKAPDVDALVAFVRQNAPTYLGDPNVTSVGVGYKIVDGQPTDQLAIQFTVRNKAQPESLSELDTVLIPPSLEVNGVTVPTDVLERDYRPAFIEVDAAPKDERKARAEVLRPGLSISNLVTKGGTLGCFVRERASGSVVILSNWHVLHGAAGAIGIDVIQPGLHDDNRVQQNMVGKLLRSHLGPAGDCAIASVSARSIANEVIGLGCKITGIGKPELHDEVIKSGRTTGVTRGKIVRVGVNTRMTYAGGVEADVGGFEIGLDGHHPQPEDELSKPGDSGSAWLAASTVAKNAVMLGLHFGGNAGTQSEYALACYAQSVMMALDVEPLTVETTATLEAVAETLEIPSGGFDTNFLPMHVTLPRFAKTVAADLVQINGDPELRYCHFSVWLSKSRRYARCVAWNVDGSAIKVVKDRGFRTDRRDGLEAFQLSPAIYVGNPLDQGHIARRADVSWGTLEAARQASYDSCYYTNIAPQQAAFNRSSIRTDDPLGGSWGRLENTLLDSGKAHGMRFSLLGGPIITDSDPRFIQGDVDCSLPLAYWKVVVYRDQESGQDRAYGFLLSQARALGALAIAEELPLDEWAWAQISLRDLENQTDLKFSAQLKQYERNLPNPETIAGDAITLRFIRTDDQFFV